MDYFSKVQFNLTDMKAKSIHLEESDRRLNNSANDKKLKEKQFKTKLVEIQRRLNDKDAFFLIQQFRDSVGDIDNTSDGNLTLTLFDLLIDSGIISSSHCNDLIAALIDIRRDDLALILKETIVNDDRKLAKSNYNSLSDEFILNVCKQLSPSDLTDLGVLGFGLSLSQVLRAKYDAKLTMDAAIDIFTQWKNEAPLNELERSHDNIMPLYGKEGLRSALSKAKLNYVVSKVF